MTEKMHIVTDGKWTRRKIGTAVFDDTQFVITPPGESPRNYALQDLQSVQWTPNGWDDRMLRNPALAFVLSFVLALIISFVLFLIKGRGWSLPGMLGFCVVFTCGVAYTKAHRARFLFANGDAFLLGISRSFAQRIRSLKPGIGPQ